MSATLNFFFFLNSLVSLFLFFLPVIHKLEERENEESTSSSISYFERMACGSEGKKEAGEMDSVFFTMGRWGVHQDFATGMFSLHVENTRD